MGLNDQEEKIRQAQNWLCDPAADAEHWHAAYDFLVDLGLIRRGDTEVGMLMKGE